MVIGPPAIKYEKVRKMIDLGALLCVPCVEAEMGFDLSPDGKKAAFSWNLDGQWEIYELRLEAGAVPVKVSHGSGSKSHPRYAPDGRNLAYAVDLDGSEAYRLMRTNVETGKTLDLTPHEKCSLQADFCWSPDGKSLAFISDLSGQFNTYVLPREGGEARLVLDAGYPAWKVRWSPDGAWLAVTVEAGGIDYNTFIVSPHDGKAVRVLAESGAPIDAGQVCWSPDGSQLVFTSDVHGYNHIGIYELSTNQITWLTQGEAEDQFPTWSPDGKSLAYIHNRGTISWLALHEIGKMPEYYQVEAGVHYIPRFTADGDTIILIFSNPRHPEDLWSFSIKEKGFRQLTFSLPKELSDLSLPMPEEICYPGLDGTPVPALMFRQAGQITCPGIILVHGGPDWFFEMCWYPIMTHLASRGWVVLAPNYRGSTGYGRAWQEASRFDFGGVDNDDIIAGAHYLINNKLADPRRIGVTGRSHGGYLTMTCVTKSPDLWAAGSAVVPFINWFTNHKFIRADLQHWDLENFGDPEINHDLWVERSPYYFLDQVTAPLQLIAGRLDQRCPVSDSIEAHEALTRMGKKAELIIYEDEGHTFLKIENVIDAECRRVAFLAKYLETGDGAIR